ncbi:MAG: HAD superfamily hydrolase (TIGR01549 family) [Phenylobacterium sp.]|jgi:HAD superfamily hydrolase (TIGR01549 family)
MIHFYRRLPSIKAISFDLDDTLYNNLPILQKAEQAQLDFIHQQVPQARATTIKDWMVIRQQLPINDHIGLWRQQGIYHGLLQWGLSDEEAQIISQQAFEVFYQWRNKIELSPQVLNVLKQLGNLYPLIALTNGNASIEAIGLSSVFEFAIAAGDNGLSQKPATDMFDAAIKKLAIKPHELLHIGDSLSSDVQGALNAGCSAVWFNPHGRRLSTASNLPHVEIDTLQALSLLY